ncbi:hypothetical protein D3C71_1207870 [compost metagenome]
MFRSTIKVCWSTVYTWNRSNCMRPDTCANAGIHCPSTPSRAIRASVSTARGLRSNARNCSRADAGASV